MRLALPPDEFNPDTLDARAFELKAKAASFHAEAESLHAKAARLRATTTSEPTTTWIRVDKLPVPKRTALAACRSGELRAVKRGRTWLTTRADADAYLASTKATPAANDASTDDDVRARLGLAKRSPVDVEGAPLRTARRASA